MLETRGARSGAPRRNAVIYFHDGDRVVVAASEPIRQAWPLPPEAPGTETEARQFRDEERASWADCCDQEFSVPVQESPARYVPLPADPVLPLDRPRCP